MLNERMFILLCAYEILKGIDKVHNQEKVIPYQFIDGTTALLDAQAFIKRFAELQKEYLAPYVITSDSKE
jgi:hypothetical protein